MRRSELRSVINTAARNAGCNEVEVARLVGAAKGIERVAVGSFVITEPGLECGCPATVAGYFNSAIDRWNEDAGAAVQKFPDYFDNSISADTTKCVRDRYEYLPIEDD